MSPEENDDHKPMSKKEAYFAVASSALVGLAALSHPFITIFVGSALAIPVSMDIHKHGDDNILNRAWKELKEAWTIVSKDLKETFDTVETPKATYTTQEKPSNLAARSVKEGFDTAAEKPSVNDNTAPVAEAEKTTTKAPKP